jgi:hypothetical protein
LILLTATIKSLTDSLQAKKGTNTGCSSNRQSRGWQGTWKYNASLGIDSIYSCSIKGNEPKTYNDALAPGMVARRCGFADMSQDANLAEVQTEAKKE